MITTQDCKKAIVEWVLKNPGYIATFFYDLHEIKNPSTDEMRGEIKEMDEWATEIKNWKREAKEKEIFNGMEVTERRFDCRPFDSQVRAYVYDDGEQILKIIIQGE